MRYTRKALADLATADIGTELSDMHYGLDHFLEDYGLDRTRNQVQHICLRVPNGNEIVRQLLGPTDRWYTNKMLVVVEVDYEQGAKVIKCAYSYDSANLGLVSFSVATSS